MIALVGAIAVAWVAALLVSPPAVAVTATLTVTITSVDGVGDDLDGIGRGDADLYAGITFDRGLVSQRRTDGTSFDAHVDDDPTITPFWPIGEQAETFTVNSVPTARITIAIWDHDDCTSPFCPDADT